MQGSKYRQLAMHSLRCHSSENTVAYLQGLDTMLQSIKLTAGSEYEHVLAYIVDATGDLERKRKKYQAVNSAELTTIMFG